MPTIPVIPSAISTPLVNQLSTPPKKNCTPSRIVTITLFLIIITLVFIDLATTKYTTKLVESAIDSLKSSPVLGFTSLTSLYVVFTVLLIPGSLLTLGSGFAFTQSLNSPLYGTLVGTLSVLIGASFGSMLAFLLARYMFRSSVDSCINRSRTSNSNLAKYVALLSSSMETSGLRVMFLLRLSPIIPFNVLNYVAGATRISFMDFVKALVGIVPGTVLFVYLGATAGSLSSAGEEGGTLKVIFLVVGGILGFAGIGIIGRKAREELLREEETEREGDDEKVLDP